jgi:hypothetical protein
MNTGFRLSLGIEAGWLKNYSGQLHTATLDSLSQKTFSGG